MLEERRKVPVLSLIKDTYVSQDVKRSVRLIVIRNYPFIIFFYILVRLRGMVSLHHPKFRPLQ